MREEHEPHILTVAEKLTPHVLDDFRLLTLPSSPVQWRLCFLSRDPSDLSQKQASPCLHREVPVGKCTLQVTHRPERTLQPSGEKGSALGQPGAWSQSLPGLPPQGTSSTLAPPTFWVDNSLLWGATL